MFFTLFYAASTSFQSWRLNAIHQKISRVIEVQKNSVVFLKKSDGNSHGAIFSFQLVNIIFQEVNKERINKIA